MLTSAITGMHKDTQASIILPVYNEAATIQRALESFFHQRHRSNNEPVKKQLYEIIIVDNNSSDNTIPLVREFQQANPEMNIIIQHEPRQGVAWARKSGMELAILRSRDRDAALHAQDNDYYLFSADADCQVDTYWLDSLLRSLNRHHALTVCNYTYPEQHFRSRPSLWNVIKLLLKARDHAMRLFGGFPDGKGFALPRSIYEKVNGIDIFYQVCHGDFICHLSDDWDFGIKTRASGHEITYAHDSIVMTNPRRIDHALDEMINGIAYGKNGIIGMRDIRPDNDSVLKDLNAAEALRLYEFSIKDFTTKHIILPSLLTPSILDKSPVREFLTSELCELLARRISEIAQQMRVTDFSPIHLYKTPCYRLYFEFRDKIFERMRSQIDPAIGLPPPLPECLEKVERLRPDEFTNYVYYYCEDRESGEAHNYFGNGGVF